jgi:opacity protein-like surface antigen
MKRLLLLCVLCFAISASAQTIGFGVHGNMINSDVNAKVKEILNLDQTTPGTLQVALDEVYGLGFGGGIHLDISLPIISVRISGDYLTISPDKDKFSQYVKQSFGALPVSYVEGGKVDMISGNANVKLVVLPLPVFKPYATGGIGVCNVQATDVTLKFGSNNITTSILKKQTVMTYNVGVGLDIQLGSVAIYAELKGNWIPLEEGTVSLLPIATAGITF